MCDPASPCMMCCRAASLDAMRYAEAARASARDEATLRECGLDAPARPPADELRAAKGIATGAGLGCATWLLLAAAVLWLLARLT